MYGSPDLLNWSPCLDFAKSYALLINFKSALLLDFFAFSNTSSMV